MKIYMNAATISRFIERELANWPLAAQNYEALKMVQTKHLSVDGFDVKVQFNPARRVSTGAKSTAAAYRLVHASSVRPTARRSRKPCAGDPTMSFW